MHVSGRTEPRAPASRTKGRRESLFVRAARHWPLSPAGLALLALSLGLLAFGRTRMDIVLTLAGLFWIALAAVTGLVTCAAAFALHAAARRIESVEPLRTTEGAATPTGFAVRRWPIPLAARPSVRWVTPAGDAVLERTGHDWRERVRPLSRARATHVIREFVQEDLLGLWRVRGRLAESRPVLILPDTGRLSAAELAACLSSGDLLSYPWGPAKGDPIDSRPYTHSDPARLILWKVYARTRHLVVRSPEQARSPDLRPLVYLVAGADDEAAAGVVRVFIESRLLGDGARFAADGHPVPSTEPGDALDAVCGSAAHRGRGAADLAAALAHPTVDATDPVLVVAPAVRGPWTAPLEAAIARAPDRFVVLFAGDAALTAAAGRGWRTWVLRQPPAGGPTWDDMLALGRRFGARGVKVALADRTSGRTALVAGHEAPVTADLVSA